MAFVAENLLLRQPLFLFLRVANIPYTMTTLIIDDEQQARTNLKNFITSFCPDFKIKGEADGIETGLEKINSIQPEIVFLDVEMDDGTGFDLLDRVPKIDFEVIFVTGHNDFAIRAFRYSAIDYLLKPLNKAEFMQAVEKVRQKKGEHIDKRLKVMMANIQQPLAEQFVIHTATSIHFVKTLDILRCEGEASYTEVHLTNGERITDSKNIKEYDKFLTDPRFFRVHRSHLINLHSVKTFEKEDGGFLVMADGAEIPVARRRKQALMDKLVNP